MMFPCLERDTADFSECGRYRFRLTRRFKDGIGVVNFIMLNPSTATADIDDPTIRRCMAFARAWRLRAALKSLKQCGYSCYRWRADDGEYESDPSVLVERTDGIPEHKIREGWKR